MWTGVIQQINAVAGVASGAALNTAKFTLDQYANCTYIQGPLDQVVTVGAGFTQYGVQVGTALMGFGAAYPTGFAHTTISTTKGNTSATVASGSGFVNGYVIGAIQVVGTNVTQVLSAGTTYTISGTSVTLSLPALVGGSGFYCCSVEWVSLGGVVHP
jgi:hypothetical protein